MGVAGLALENAVGLWTVALAHVASVNVKKVSLGKPGCDTRAEARR